MTDPYDIAFVGNYTKDTIVTRSGTRSVDGGGFNYGAHAAALMGLKVAAITRLAWEDRRVVDALERLGVDVFPFFSEESTVLRLEYPTDNVDDRIITVQSFAGAFTADQVQSIRARAFVISGSLRGEISMDVIHRIKAKGALVAADAQSFLREVDSQGILSLTEWPQKREVLSTIDVLKADGVEAEMLTGQQDLRAAALILEKMGPSEIVLTHRDGILVFAGGEMHEAPFFPRKLVGRSGRGDTCIASYTAKRLSSPPREAALWAAAVTSLKMEAEGPILRSMEEVHDLLGKKYSRL